MKVLPLKMQVATSSGWNAQSKPIFKTIPIQGRLYTW